MCAVHFVHGLAADLALLITQDNRHDASICWRQSRALRSQQFTGVGVRTGTVHYCSRRVDDITGKWQLKLSAAKTQLIWTSAKQRVAILPLCRGPSLALEMDTVEDCRRCTCYRRPLHSGLCIMRQVDNSQRQLFLPAASTTTCTTFIVVHPTVTVQSHWSTLRFCTEFDHMTADTLQTFKVKRSNVKVTAW